MPRSNGRGERRARVSQTLRARALPRAPSQHRNRSLALSLIVMALLYPFALESQGGGMVMTLAFGVVVTMASWAISTTQVHQWMAVVLAVPTVGLGVWSLLDPNVPLMAATAAVRFVFFALVIKVMLKGLLWEGEEVTAERLWGVGALYMLIGIAFAQLYALVHTTDPGAFDLGGTQPLRVRWLTFIYFSFMTLTSTGYGDVLPVSALARSVAMLESIAGVMFTGIFIARLTSLYQPAPPPYQAPPPDEEE